MRICLGGPIVQESDHWHRGLLLRTRHDWAREHHAAYKCDELTPPHAALHVQRLDRLEAQFLQIKPINERINDANRIEMVPLIPMEAEEDLQEDTSSQPS